VLTVLLFPAAALALYLPRRGRLRLLWALLGLLPLVIYLLALLGGVIAGVVNPFGGFQGGLAALFVILAAFVAYAVMLAVTTPANLTPVASALPSHVLS
jgi:hypothetical protein